jgi:hypothetical protein
MFTPTYSTEQLMHMVEQLVESFHPRLILGVSDEVPAAESREAIEKVRLVSEWCEQCNLIW